MKTFLDCVPCFVKQALDAARMATDDEALQERILRAVLEKTAAISFSESPPHMARQIHRIVREISGDPDPYRAVKRHYDEVALHEYDRLAGQVRDSTRPFETAVRLAIAGNIIDFGVASWDADAPLWETVQETLRRPFAIDDLPRLEAAVADAAAILYLGDNTGEIVFDKLLLAQLPADRTTYVVKGLPIINDATMEDARAVGLTEMVEVVDNGSDAPGTILELCSEDSRARFERADLVIAKGQANYETLSHVGRGGLFFLLKVKCPVVARDLGCEIGSIVVKENRGEDQS